MANYLSPHRDWLPIPVAVLVSGVLTGAILLGSEPPRAATDGDTLVDFDAEIAPLFSRHCLGCHGADAQGGLKLSDREAAAVELDSGLRAIVPGDPEASELLRRVASNDPSERMPPEGDPLSAEQIEWLRLWIAAGAEWPSHWAYRSLQPPAVPEPQSSEFGPWAITPIDRFVLEKLQQRGLRPAPPADRRTLLRRLSLDLLGLAPTEQELADFMADTSADAVERAVDRLLASPHYGERWARHWMDVVHFAETHGHDQDRPRPHAWPYRDYLVQAFNEGKPYARFVREQVAGDVLYPFDPQAIEATGFLAAGPWDESSLRDIREDAIDREIARYLDRDDIVTTVLSSFASSTVHCARCHDHKFDPISQREYFALQAVFAGIDKAERTYDRDPQVARTRAELLSHQAELVTRREQSDASLLTAEVSRQVAAWEAELLERPPIWQVLLPHSSRSSDGSTLTIRDDGSVLASGERPAVDTYRIEAETDLRTITGVRLEVLSDAGLPQGGPGRQDNGNLHLNRFRVTAAPADDPDAAVELPLRNPRASFDQPGWTIAMAIDGNPNSAWGIFPEVGTSHHAVFELSEPLELVGPTVLTFTLEQTHGGGHLIGRPRLSATAVSGPLPLESDLLPLEITQILRVAPEERTVGQRVALAAFWLEQHWAAELAALPPQQKVYAGTSRFEPDGSFRPATSPRPVHLLKRGEIGQRGEQVPPAAPSLVAELAGSLDVTEHAEEGSRRVALACWLADERNVLVWRSIANRLWHYHFGRGLVDTPNDFGRMGSSPTHPQLLDYLALQLQRRGGSLKDLQRLIVTSAVYRQSSRHAPEMAVIDAENRYLWRMNRRRLDAESIRDTVLAASGQLDRTMGGPSVRQFIESPGVHVTPNVDYQNFDRDDPANHRRSVYRFLFRTLPDPFMESLDCADASQLTPVRNASVTAVQALAMLNNPFLVHQSEQLAERLSGQHQDVSEQVRALYGLVLLRPPNQDELQRFVRYAELHGLANAARMLLNSNEFMFVD